MKLAVFPLSGTGGPSVVAPTENVTVPVGSPLPGAFADTVAVKVTDCPKNEGFIDEATIVVVRSRLTVCDKGRGGAGREVGVAAVHSRDRLTAADAQLEGGGR